MCDIIESLDIQHLYRTSHQLFFKAIKDLAKQEAPVDLSSISQYLQDKKLTDRASISELAEILDSPVSIDLNYYIRILREKYALRKSIEICNAGIKRCMDTLENPDDTIEFLKTNIEKLDIEGDVEEAAKSASELVSSATERYDEIASGEREVGVQTGFFLLDKRMSGMKYSNLLILAARPSMGKTAFAVNILLNCGVPAAMFSLEQSNDQLMDRMLAIKTRLDLLKFTNANFTDEEWKKVNTAAGALYESQIFIDDTPALTIEQIKSRSRRLKRKHNIQLVIVDYIQLTRPSFRGYNNRNLEIEETISGLKAIAKELYIPVLALSQLNRNLENRPNPQKRPRLSDLRDSGSLEQTADDVLFLYRPEVYQSTEDLMFENQADIIVAKQRQGPIFTMNTRLDPTCVRFSDIDFNH